MNLRKLKTVGATKDVEWKRLFNKLNLKLIDSHYKKSGVLKFNHAVYILEKELSD